MQIIDHVADAALYTLIQMSDDRTAGPFHFVLKKGNTPGELAGTLPP